MRTFLPQAIKNHVWQKVAQISPFFGRRAEGVRIKWGKKEPTRVASFFLAAEWNIFTRVEGEKASFSRRSEGQVLPLLPPEFTALGA